MVRENLYVGATILVRQVIHVIPISFILADESPEHSPLHIRPSSPLRCFVYLALSASTRGV